MSHTKSTKLEDQAANAALYVTKGKNETSSKPSTYPLDADGKLSSASAATSLKHARPQDLPAYPVLGLENHDSSAGAAASLANANKKPLELWQPGELPAASKAAYSAKDYKADPIWQPELGPAGSKAALQAHTHSPDVKLWKPSETDAGHSAAGQAMRKKGLGPQVKRGTTAEGEQKALMAAVGAVSGSRKRSDSTPVARTSYPDADNSAANALKAATSANRPSRKPQAPASPSQPPIDAAKIHNQAVTNLSREMYTSRPPVAPETDERHKQDTLRAAAVSMAKKMYDVQQKQMEEAATQRRSESQLAAGVAERPLSSASSSGSTEPPKYTNLQEAAQKLAAERLAKLHDEHSAYRSYYGTNHPPNKRLSMRGRRRASSEGGGGESDQEKSKQIRKQMSIFSSQVAQVDEQKRKKDRDSLLAAAQRNVRASMHAQDERVFSETGKVSPAMMAEWEAKAKAKAEAESQVRMANHGMVSIGGGKFLDQSEVDAIAAAKVQPTLNDITETAEKHRARDEELRQQRLERERLLADKSADDQERAVRTKEEWKKFRDEEKQDEKARKEEAKARKAEEKKRREEEKSKAGDRRTIGKLKGIFVKDDSNEGNQDALGKLEGKTNVPQPSVIEEPIRQDVEVVKPTKTAPEPASAPATDAEETARRVLAAPVIFEGGGPSDDAVHTRIQEPMAPKSVQDEPTIERAEKPVAPSSQATPPKDTSYPSAELKASLSERIAPPPATMQPKTETTVTGPTSPTETDKDKDGSKVSSWLKSKLSRRTSKATPTSPDTKPTISAPKDPKVFIGAANLGAPDSVTTASSEPADDSMREVAMAGKEAGPVDAPVVSPTSELEEAEVAPAAAVTGASGEASDGDESSSVSSLSSDEDTRGRSAMRLADQIEQSGPILGTTAAVHESRVPAGGDDKTESKDFAPAGTAEAQRGSSDGRADDFEEARDQFDSEGLEPPRKGILGSSTGEGRKSDSPVRDSKFVENL